ncbi:MAG: hypothetical protein K6G42_07875 [Lachnospiraceae bacterium]|nr:hypothetical protein [Lachnospiraceae bacterium]
MKPNLKTYLKGLGLGIFVTTLIMTLSSNSAKGEMSDEEVIARASELGMISENALLLKEAQELADNSAPKDEQTPGITAGASSVSAPQTDDKGAVSINGQISGNKTVSSNGEIVDVTPVVPVASEKENKAGTAGTGSDTAKTGTNSSTADNAKSSTNSSTADNAKSSTNSSTADNDRSSTNSSTADNAKSSTNSSTTGNTAGNTNAGTGSNAEAIVINVSSGDSSASVAVKMVKAGLIDDARQFDSYLVLSGYDRKLVVGSHSIPKGSTAEQMGEILTTKQ